MGSRPASPAPGSRPASPVPGTKRPPSSPPRGAEKPEEKKSKIKAEDWVKNAVTKDTMVGTDQFFKPGPDKHHVFHGKVDTSKVEDVKHEHVKEILENAHDKVKDQAKIKAATNHITSAYHDPKITKGIHISTIGSHGGNKLAMEPFVKKTDAHKEHGDAQPALGKAPGGSWKPAKAVLLDNMKEKAPMTYEASKRVNQLSSETDWPHAEIAAMVHWEHGIANHPDHKHKSAEERKKLALEHFDRNNLHTHGRFGLNSPPTTQGPCLNKCEVHLSEIGKMQKEAGFTDRASKPTPQKKD